MTSEQPYPAFHAHFFDRAGAASPKTADAIYAASFLPNIFDGVEQHKAMVSSRRLARLLLEARIIGLETGAHPASLDDLPPTPRLSPYTGEGAVYEVYGDGAIELRFQDCEALWAENHTGREARGQPFSACCVMTGMHFADRLAITLSLALIGCSGVNHEPAGPAETPARLSARAHIEIRIKPFPELYFEIRAQAADLGPIRPELADAVRAWDPVKAEVGTFGGFWRFDLAGMLSSDPDEFRTWMEQYPESMSTRSGGSIPLRASGEALTTGIAGAWPDFVASTWPERERALKGIRNQLDAEFMPKHRDALAYMLEALAIDDPGLAVPLYLVTHTHPPGASTYRSRGGPLVVLSTSALLLNGRISDLYETVLHETCHTLDAASDGETDAFSILRRLLAETGIEERDPRMRDIPHLLMFVQSEETIRRFYDQNHIAYGDSTRGDIAPLYERSGPAAGITRRHWRRFLNEEISRHEALDLIVRESLVTD